MTSKSTPYTIWLVISGGALIGLAVFAFSAPANAPLDKNRDRNSLTNAAANLNTNSDAVPRSGPVAYDWLPYVDPQGRFAFYYPPSYRVDAQAGGVFIEPEDGINNERVTLETTTASVEDAMRLRVESEMSRTLTSAGTVTGVIVVDRQGSGRVVRYGFFRADPTTFVWAGRNITPDMDIISSFKLLGQAAR